MDEKEIVRIGWKTFEVYQMGKGVKKFIDLDFRKELQKIIEENFDASLGRIDFIGDTGEGNYVGLRFEPCFELDVDYEERKRLQKDWQKRAKVFDAEYNCTIGTLKQHLFTIQNYNATAENFKENVINMKMLGGLYRDFLQPTHQKTESD